MLSCVAACLLALSGGDEVAKKPVLTPQTRRQIRAQRIYDRLWAKKFASAFGKEGLPAPELRTYRKGEPGAPDYTGMMGGPDGPIVALSPQDSRRLARLNRKPGPNAARWRRRKAEDNRRDMQSLLLHEWAHVHQNTADPRFWQDPNLPRDRMLEGAAAQFQRHVGRKLIKGPKRANGKGRRPYRSHMYYKERDYVKKNTPKAWWLRGQFGDNYGPPKD